MKTLRLHVTHDKQTTTLFFTSFPVRIGRDEVNECQLTFPFISRTHAVLELEDERLLLRDGGSRYGTHVCNHTRKLAPDERLDLASVGYEFQIGAMGLRAELRDAEGASTVPATPYDDGESGARPHNAPQNATEHYAAQRIDPRVVDAHAIVVQLRVLLERQRAAWDEITALLGSSLPTLDTSRRAAILNHLALEFPRLRDERAFRDLAKRYGVEIEGSGELAVPTEADIALRGLQELAATYVPYAPPLASREAIVAFLGKLDDSLKACFETFVALRFAHRSELHEPVEPEPRISELGARLLDWTSASDAARVDLENLGRDLLTHHAQLAEEVRRGVSRVLTLLSPDAIERHVAGELHPLSLLFGESRARWRVLRERFARFSNEHFVRMLFGPRFALLCAALAGEKAPAHPEDPPHEKHSDARAFAFADIAAALL